MNVYFNQPVREVQCDPVILLIFVSFSAELGGVFQRQCLTCGLVDDCNFFQVQFSPNLTYFFLHCLGKAQDLGFL